MEERMISGRNRTRRLGLIAIGVFAFLLLASVGWASSLLIEYSWWKEMGQVTTWLDLYAWSTVPVSAATLIAWLVLWVTHSRAVRFAGGRASDYPIYNRLAGVALLGLSAIVSDASLDSSTILRFAGSRSVDYSHLYHDPIFGKSAAFYLFDLPFWADLRGYLLAVVVAAIVVCTCWLRVDLAITLCVTGSGPGSGRFVVPQAAGWYGIAFPSGRGGVLPACDRVPLLSRPFCHGVEPTPVPDRHRLHGRSLCTAAELAGDCVARSGRRADYGQTLDNIAAALLRASASASYGSSHSVASSLFVKPNEISLERPYIESHIEATRSAYGLSTQIREVEMHTNPGDAIDTAKNKVLLDNVRLWDWRHFPRHSNPDAGPSAAYYAFHAADVDRYTVDGQPREVLLSPRELEIKQLPGTQSSWINPHFIYTHGYGLVLAEVAKITAEGQPVYLVNDMPAQINTSSLKLPTRPELYYGELQQEPVFVDTAQQEFNYPQGSDNAFGRYQGKGGFPISSLPMRLAAALHFGDSNIVLTSYLTERSRMMIHRKVRERLEVLTPYLRWDNDPYLVISPEGRRSLDG